MKQGHKPAGNSETSGMSLSEEIGVRSRETVSYLLVLALILVIYAATLTTNKVLFFLVRWCLRDAVSKYPPVTIWFERFEMGLAFLVILGAFIHGVKSFMRLQQDIDRIRDAQ